MALFALLLVHLFALTSWAATIRVPQDVATIQGAINTATTGDTVLVAPGTYTENINYLGKAITVTGDQGPEVTIIDGNFAGPVVQFFSGEPASSVLTGFTLTNGNGSGVQISQDSSPTIENNRVINNIVCGDLSGAIRILNSSGAPVVRNNYISANRCGPGQGGAGLALLSSSGSPQISDNVIADHHGRGIYMSGGGASIIRNNTIRANQGGGIGMNNFADASIVQNLIVGNGNPFTNGGGIHWLVPAGGRGPFVVNNTIVDNESQGGSGIFADGFDAQTLLANNLIIGKPGETAVLCGNFNNLETPIFKSNNVFSPGGTAYGGICTDQTGLNGNISAPPLFLDPANGIYYLQVGSPAIDAGDNLAPDLPSVDFDGIPRILDGNADGLALADLGAFESPPSPGIIQFAASPYVAAEFSKSAVISVIRRGGTDGEVAVDYATSPGTALAGLDYVPTTGTLTFLNGESIKKFSVPLIVDKFDEPVETVKLHLSNVSGGASLGMRSSAVLEISDAGAIQFSAASYSAAESQNGISFATITVTRVGGAVGEVSVVLSTSDGTASSKSSPEGFDFYPIVHSVNFANGDSAPKIIQVTINNDAVHEGNEWLTLALGNPTGGAVLGNPTTAVLTIIDDEPSPPEPPPSVQLGPYFPIDSGDSWAYVADGGSFTRTVLSGTVTINNLVTKALADNNGFTQYFSNDSAGIRLHRQFSPHVDIGLSKPVDLRLTFSPPMVFANATMAVGESVMTNGTARTNKLPQVGVLELPYSSSFTAQGFEILTVPLGTFRGLKLQGHVNVGGEVTEETLYLVENIGTIRLVDASGGIIQTANLAATNNFTLPIVTVTATSPAAAENGSSGIFTISRSGDTTQLLTVSYTVAGTATMGIDYKALTGSLTIPIGAVSANISIDPIDDILAEPDETVVLTISASSSYSVGGPSSASIVIVNNDAMNPIAHVDCATMSLQSVIDLAEAGSTLLVNGICSEAIRIGNNLRRIQLDGGGSAVIVGTDPSAPALLVRGKGILIQGFTISGGSDGIHIDRGSNAVINNNFIGNTNGNGILVDELAVAVITYNAIQNNPGAGIFISENSTARIGFDSDAETSASPNAIENNGAGIWLSNNSSARIVGNHVAFNSMNGIVVGRNSHADLASNEIDGNGGDGISVEENSVVQLGEDGGTSIYESANMTTSMNIGVGIRCATGSVVDGRRGTLSGAGGVASFAGSCIDSLAP